MFSSKKLADYLLDDSEPTSPKTNKPRLLSVTSTLTLPRGMKDASSQAIEEHWAHYNLDRAFGQGGGSSLPTFMKALPCTLRDAFESSKNRIIDLGVSTGEQHLKSLSKGRPVIGYDHSQIAIQQAQHHGLTTRHCDLNKINDANEQLSCHSSLETDLSQPVDVFMIYILEYLNPKALILLLHALIEHAKPGSCFYIQTRLVLKKTNSTVDFVYKMPQGYIPSFFGARTDMSCMRHVTATGERSKTDTHFDVEQYVVKKV